MQELIRVRPRQGKEDYYGSEQPVVKAEIRTGHAICQSLEKEKLQAIQQSTGAKLTQQGTDHVPLG